MKKLMGLLIVLGLSGCTAYKSAMLHIKEQEGNKLIVDMAMNDPFITKNYKYDKSQKCRYVKNNGNKSYLALAKKINIKTKNSNFRYLFIGSEYLGFKLEPPIIDIYLQQEINNQYKSLSKRRTEVIDPEYKIELIGDQKVALAVHWVDSQMGSGISAKQIYYPVNNQLKELYLTENKELSSMDGECTYSESYTYQKDVGNEYAEYFPINIQVSQNNVGCSGEYNYSKSGYKNFVIPFDYQKMQYAVPKELQKLLNERL